MTKNYKEKNADESEKYDTLYECRWLQFAGISSVKPNFFFPLLASPISLSTLFFHQISLHVTQLYPQPFLLFLVLGQNLQWTGGHWTGLSSSQIFLHLMCDLVHSSSASSPSSSFWCIFTTNLQLTNVFVSVESDHDGLPLTTDHNGLTTLNCHWGTDHAVSGFERGINPMIQRCFVDTFAVKLKWQVQWLALLAMWRKILTSLLSTAFDRRPVSRFTSIFKQSLRVKLSCFVYSQ